ncbi:MAG TPA: SMP-30/gluconolactonase/LRE family protein [Chitinophagaceae bacterium]|nr:SMP-30/gluconolactonase/LRE family protein [Chitinophagaceae bacterium]
MKRLITCSILFVIVACTNNKKEQTNYKTIGTIERLDPALDSIISPGAQAEIIADSFVWSEGPVWVESQKMLLVSDVKKNTVYKWTEEKGKEVYLTPSGYTGTIPRGGEMGSNGLTLDNNGNLVLCQDGDRQMGRMDAPLDKPEAKYVVLANNYKGKKFNSPNDLVFNSNGELFFTDPPYGLENGMIDPKKEIPFQGVYKVKANGEVILLLDSLTRPNGIAFLSGQKQIVIANSDPDKPNWYIYDVKGDSLANGRIFYSAAGYDRSLKGLPDGMKVDKNGNVFAAGPGGFYFFNSNGKLLGELKVPDAPSNCALSTDQKTLYMTNDMQVLRLKMRN